MDSGELLAQFRLAARDQGTETLWSDAEVLLYLDEAQKQFCRLTGGIADASSSAARLKAKAGQGFAALSPRVLKLRAAFGDDGRALKLTNFEDYELSPTGGSELFSQEQGIVTALVLGMEPNKVRLVKIPAADDTFQLIIDRLPLDDITGPGQDLEIDAQHHLALLKWALYLAHSKQDAEAYNRGRAEEFRQQFELYCAQAKAERERHTHKYRSVAFSW